MQTPSGFPPYHTFYSSSLICFSYIHRCTDKTMSPICLLHSRFLLHFPIRALTLLSPNTNVTLRLPENLLILILCSPSDRSGPHTAGGADVNPRGPACQHPPEPHKVPTPSLTKVKAQPARPVRFQAGAEAEAALSAIPRNVVP